MTEDEMVGWHRWLNGREFEQAPRDSEGQGSLECCSPRGHRVGHDWVAEQQWGDDRKNVLGIGWKTRVRGHIWPTTRFYKQSFIGTQLCSFAHLFKAIFMLQWQSWVITTEAVQSAEKQSATSCPPSQKWQNTVMPGGGDPPRMHWVDALHMLPLSLRWEYKDSYLTFKKTKKGGKPLASAWKSIFTPTGVQRVSGYAVLAG